MTQQISKPEERIRIARRVRLRQTFCSSELEKKVVVLWTVFADPVTCPLNGPCAVLLSMGKDKAGAIPQEKMQSLFASLFLVRKRNGKFHFPRVDQVNYLTIFLA